MTTNTIDLTNWEILIVDDEPDNLTVLDTLLNFFDARVTSAGSGEEALELLKTRTFKLGLFDIQMPKVSGWDLVKWVRGSEKQETRDTCLIAVTALAMPGDEERVLQAGFDGYVAKPIDAAVFMDSVQAVLARPKGEGQPSQEPKAESVPTAANVGLSEKMSQVISEVRTHTERIGEVDLTNVADLLESNGHLLDVRYDLQPQDDYPSKSREAAKETQESPAVAPANDTVNDVPPTLYIVQKVESADSITPDAQSQSESKPTDNATPADNPNSTEQVTNGTTATGEVANRASQSVPTLSTNGAQSTEFSAENPAASAAPDTVNIVQEAK